MIRITTHRAILDWYRRARSAGSVEEGETERMPGVVSMTGHRLTFELNKPLADLLLKICDQALADETLHDAKRNAIAVTRKQLVDAMSAEEER